MSREGGDIVEGFDASPGTSKLARVLSQRIKKEGESPLVLDFGEIQMNGSLLTNTFPIPIPAGDFSVCRHVGGLECHITGGNHSGHEDHSNGSHNHDLTLPAIMPGDRVLVAWVHSEAVVIDVIVRS